MSRQGSAALVGAAERDLRHRVVQHPGTDRMPFGVVRVEQARGRCPVDHLSKLPSQVHGVLHAGVEALSTVRTMHMGGVSGEQHSPLAVRSRLSGHVGESRDPGRAVHAEVGSVGGDERVAEVLECGFTGVLDIRLEQHDPVRPSARRRVDGTDAATLGAHADLWLLGHLDLGDHEAARRIPPWEVDAGRLADQAASAVTPDEVFGPQRCVAGLAGQLDVDTGSVLRQSDDLAAAKDRHRELLDPAGQDPLDLALPESQHAVVAGGEVADVQDGPGEAQERMLLPR